MNILFARTTIRCPHCTIRALDNLISANASSSILLANKNMNCNQRLEVNFIFSTSVMPLNIFMEFATVLIIRVPVNSSHDQLVTQSPRHTVNSSQSIRHTVNSSLTVNSSHQSTRHVNSSPKTHHKLTVTITTTIRLQLQFKELDSSCDY